MLKKIALAAIFSLASVISIGTSTVNAAKPGSNTVKPNVGAPVMKGFNICGYCK